MSLILGLILPILTTILSYLLGFAAGVVKWVINLADRWVRRFFEMQWKEQLIAGTVMSGSAGTASLLWSYPAWTIERVQHLIEEIPPMEAILSQSVIGPITAKVIVGMVIGAVIAHMARRGGEMIKKAGTRVLRA